jgi:hypothetical protein
MRAINISGGVIGLVMALALPAWPDDLAAIKQALDAQYALTTTTADKSDIVTPGAVLVLKKSGLVTVDVKGRNLCQNIFRNGRITQNAMGKTSKFFNRLPGASEVGAGGGDRTFVSGEKVWVTGIEVKETGVVFTLFTDAYSDTRYGGTLMFPFEKYQTPTASAVAAQIALVFDIQQSDSGGGQQQQQLQGQPAGQQQAQKQTVASPRPAGADAAPPPIPPPPPPPADPKEIKLGQTPDQVVGNFGQPDKIIKLAAKQIYVYKDMKVTFVGGKVSDVQ